VFGAKLAKPSPDDRPADADDLLMIDTARLNDFMHRFYGYGSWDAPLWFVGMEEGGGNTLEELECRLKSWDGSDDLVDLKDFHSKLGGTDWFSDRPKIQSTWGKLIRVALACEGRTPDRESVRTYQRDELGRKNGSTALLELLPLPSPSTSHWIYGSLELATLKDRASYRDAMIPFRTDAIRRRLKQHQPRVVLFYGLDYREHWETIVEQPFQQEPEARFSTATNSTTRFILAPHPAAMRGVRNSDYESIGMWIREQDHL
jgi:hypothetical protein